MNLVNFFNEPGSEATLFSALKFRLSAAEEPVIQSLPRQTGNSCMLFPTEPDFDQDTAQPE